MPSSPPRYRSVVRCNRNRFCRNIGQQGMGDIAFLLFLLSDHPDTGRLSVAIETGSVATSSDKARGILHFCCFRCRTSRKVAVIAVTPKGRDQPPAIESLDSAGAAPAFQAGVRKGHRRYSFPLCIVHVQLSAYR